MASLHKKIAKFLTLVLLAILLTQVAADLAPIEDDEEIVKPELKKTDEIMTTLEPPKAGSNLGFIHAFIASFSVIIVSEIGDKTFFIAAIMSMVIIKVKHC
jgi:Ca2+/H+ antiporter, TMEM165/GDT1 family